MLKPKFYNGKENVFVILILRISLDNQKIVSNKLLYEIRRFLRNIRH